jgi:acyl-CoA synthetase (AMP-forming)/AMP-acid ligase II
VAGLINGSEPVNMASIEKFNTAFAPHGLPPTTIKPSYGMAEATLFVSTIAPDARPTAVYLDREQLSAGHAVRVAPDAATAVAQVSCGQVARSEWAVIVHPDTEAELPDGEVGEIWLHGDNIGRGYWGRQRETELAFGNKLQLRLERGSHAEGSAVGGLWYRTGDLGVHLDGELYITGRIKDLVIVAERATGAGRADAAPVNEAIRAAISRRHALGVADVKLVAAGAIPRTTSGKLARRACRADYLAGNR